MRLLLTKVHGVTCFEDICTIHGVLHPTFKLACMTLGLRNEDYEWHAALNEASSWDSGVPLQNMFCSILMFSKIADLVKFWDANSVHLLDNLLHVIRWQIGQIWNLSSTKLQNLGLLEIECILNRNGRSLQNFPPMSLPSIQATVHATNRRIIDELDYGIVKPKIMHGFNNYFDFIIYIIASNLLYFIYFSD